MGIVLENRGSEQDLANAVSSYTEILSIAGEDRLVRAEALHGLSRISQIHQQYDQSEDYLEQALAISSDTTVFEAYRLEMLAGRWNRGEGGPEARFLPIYNVDMILCKLWRKSHLKYP